MADNKTSDNKSLVRKQPAALALPTFVDPNDRRGSEGITAEDIRLPRLSLAQALSPEVLRGDPKRIEGLEPGDLFSNLLQTNFKSGPVTVVVVRRETPRAIEFYPKNSKEGQGIKDRSVPLNDPRCKFSPDGTPPVATLFREYIAFEVETREPLVLSFKSTSSGAARALDTFLAMRKGPSFSTTFKISSASKTYAEGPCFVQVVQPGGPVDQATFDYAAEMYESLRGRDVAAPEAEVEASAPKADAPF
jgi:hypothetical protein